MTTPSLFDLGETTAEADPERVSVHIDGHTRTGTVTHTRHDTNAAYVQLDHGGTWLIPRKDLHAL